MTPDRHAWERPGAEEVAPGVHRIPLPLPDDGLRAVNVYAIADGDRLVMVDGGWALDESRRRLEEALAGIGHDLGDIGAFLVTHLHRDHYTQAVTIRRLLGARVLLGAGEKETLDAVHRNTGDTIPRSLVGVLRRNGAAPLVDRISPDARALDLREWEPPDEWIEDGRALSVADRTLVPIATPGHTRGHLVFHDPAAELMFCGDHVLPHITPSIGFEAAPPPSPLADYLGSLHAMLSAPDARLLPAHGPVRPSTHERVRELITHHDRRLDETAAAVRSGADTAYAVAGRLGWTSRHRAFDDLDLFNRILAVNETAAHLAVLAEQGRARRDEADGVARFH